MVFWLVEILKAGRIGSVEKSEYVKKVSGENFLLPVLLTVAAFGGSSVIIFGAGFFGIFLTLASSAMILVAALSANNNIKRAIRLSSVIPAFLSVAILSSVSLGSFADAALKASPMLFPGVIALGIWFSVIRGKNRSFAIAFSAALGTLFWLILVALNIKYVAGSIDLPKIRAILDGFFEPLQSALSSVTIDHGGTSVQIYGDNEIAAMISTAKRTFIGSLGAIMLIGSYLVTLIARIIAALFGLDRLLPSEVHDEIAFVSCEDDPDDIDVLVERIKFPWRIEISTVSAVVALAAYGVRMIFRNPEKQLALVTCAENLLILLLPGLVYVGLRAVLMSLFGKSRGMFGFRSREKNPIFAVLLIITAIILLFISPSAPFILFAAGGAVDIFSENFRRAEALHYDDDADDRKE